MNPAQQRRVDRYMDMVSDQTSTQLVPLVAQIAAAERELRFRIRVYPRWVEAQKITQATADHELAAMRAIIDTLQQLERRERLL